jgi:hypothetical protein
MSVAALASKARKHWEEWLPERTRELKEQGLFSLETQKAAERADREIGELMRNGYQQHEAEEIVLPQYILLKPEENAEMSQELLEELAEMEREYHSWMDPMVNDDD